MPNKTKEGAWKAPAVQEGERAILAYKGSSQVTPIPKWEEGPDHQRGTCKQESTQRQAHRYTSLRPKVSITILSEQSWLLAHIQNLLSGFVAINAD